MNRSEPRQYPTVRRGISPWWIMLASIALSLALLVVAVGKETQAPGAKSIHDIRFWARIAIGVYYPMLVVGGVLLGVSARLAIRWTPPGHGGALRASVTIATVLWLMALLVSTVL